MPDHKRGDGIDGRVLDSAVSGVGVPWVRRLPDQFPASEERLRAAQDGSPGLPVDSAAAQLWVFDGVLPPERRDLPDSIDSAAAGSVDQRS